MVSAGGMDQLLTTLEAAKLVGYTQDLFSLLLRRRLIDGEKKGRDWLVSSTSLHDYVKNNPKPGPKPT